MHNFSEKELWLDTQNDSCCPRRPRQAANFGKKLFIFPFEIKGQKFGKTKCFFASSWRRRFIFLQSCSHLLLLTEILWARADVEEKQINVVVSRFKIIALSSTKLNLSIVFQFCGRLRLFQYPLSLRHLLLRSEFWSPIPIPAKNEARWDLGQLVLFWMMELRAAASFSSDHRLFGHCLILGSGKKGSNRRRLLHFLATLTLDSCNSFSSLDVFNPKMTHNFERW